MKRFDAVIEVLAVFAFIVTVFVSQGDPSIWHLLQERVKAAFM